MLYSEKRRSDSPEIEVVSFRQIGKYYKFIGGLNNNEYFRN